MRYRKINRRPNVNRMLLKNIITSITSDVAVKIVGSKTRMGLITEEKRIEEYNIEPVQQRYIKLGKRVI